ncbi:MAG: hypothetical protein WA892_01395 [Ornithinimicrobium sp.]
MATTVGRVNELTLTNDTLNACVKVGMEPTDNELLTVIIEGSDDQNAYRCSMIGALVRTVLSGDLVVVWHNDDDAEIYSMKLETALN